MQNLVLPRFGRFFFLLFIYVFLPFNRSFSQQLPLLKVGLKEGLPQSTVFRMKQDNTGYMWMATQGGLCRYDGVVVRTYSQSNQGSNFVKDLDFDKTGRLWLCTIDKGIACFDGKHFNWINTSNGLVSDQVRHFCKTGSEDVFLSTVDAGIIWVDPYLNQRMIFTPEGDTVVYAREMLELKNGNIWVAHSGGILELQKNKGYRSRHIFQTDNEMLALYSDVKGDIWATGTNTILEFYTDTFSDFSDLVPKGTEVWDVVEERSTGKMYFATTGGLLIKHRNDITWLTTRNGLTVNELRSLYFDNNHDLWAGSMGGGAMVLENKGIDHFTNTADMITFSTNTLQEDKEGRIWIATNKQGIIYTDKKECYRAPGISSNELKDAFTSTTNKKTGEIWMADYDGNIIKIDNGKITWRWSNKGKTLRLLNIHYYNNALYCSTQNGFYKLDKNSNSPESISPLNGKYLSYSFHDHDGNIWALGDEGRIFRIDKYNHVKDFTEAINPERANITHGIYDPTHHLYWFTSYSGVLVWDHHRTYHITTSNGLLSDSPWSIAQDQNGDMWMGHPNGIDRVSYRTKTIKSFGYDQGFTPIETNSCAILTDRKGNIWFGTVNSATRIRVNDINTRKSIVDLCVQKVWVNDDLRFEQDLMHNQEKNISLSYNSNNLSFDLTGICFENAKDVNYSWYMQGEDDKWTGWDTHTKAVYSNLQPGKYTFKAKAKDPNGYETKQVNIKITIRKPIWNYWWFYMLEVCLMGAIIYLSFRFSADTEKNKIGNIFTLVSILIIFEGLLIYLSEYVNHLTGGVPVFQLIMNVLLAASLHPIEQFIRKFMRRWALKKRRESLAGQHPGVNRR